MRTTENSFAMVAAMALSERRAAIACLKASEGFNDRLLIMANWMYAAAEHGVGFLLDHRVEYLDICWDLSSSAALRTATDKRLRSFLVFHACVFVALGRLLPDHGPVSYRRWRALLARDLRSPEVSEQRAAIERFLCARDEISCARQVG